MNVRFEPPIPNTEKQQYKVYGRAGDYIGRLSYSDKDREWPAGYYFINAGDGTYQISAETLKDIAKALDQLNGGKR